MLREAGALINLLIIITSLCSLHGGVKWAAAAGGGGGGGERRLRLENRCGYTVWPGLLPNAGQPLLAGGGFELPAGHARDVEAPAGWSGRLWGRTGCPTNNNTNTTTTSSSSSSSSSSSASCETGDCGGGRLQCGGAGASPPATLAELTLASAADNGGGGGKDFYDVSLVDGFNLPISIVPIITNKIAAANNNNYSCGVAGCSSNLNLACPSELQLQQQQVDDAARPTNNKLELNLHNKNKAAVVVGCKSACLAFRTDAFCCAGAYASPSACTPSPYAQAFKRACPAAYSYAFDDPTSTFTCSPYSSSSSNDAAAAIVNYAIVFCPSSLSQKNANAARHNTFPSCLNNVYIQSFFGLFLSFFFSL